MLYEFYEFFMNFNKEALTNECKKCILYIERAIEQIRLPMSIECKIKKYCPFYNYSIAKLYVNKKIKTKMGD